MWSGKMSTVVSPHNMLYTVWNIIPFFRGYSQQDAQEFLSYAVFAFLFFFKIMLISLYLVEGLVWWNWLFTWWTVQLLSFGALTLLVGSSDL